MRAFSTWAPHCVCAALRLLALLQGPRISACVHDQGALDATSAQTSHLLSMFRGVEIKFITPTAAFVEASPGRPPYFCSIGELSTSFVTNVSDHFRAGQKIDGIVRPAVSLLFAAPEDRHPVQADSSLMFVTRFVTIFGPR